LSEKNSTLIVITGATASGKTEVALSVAKALECDIISADSRQIFRDIPIGTAAPAPAEMEQVRHHFVGTHALNEYFSAAEFESEVIKLIPTLGQVSVMAGGSMMYVDAVCNGIDNLPSISAENRQRAMKLWESGGLQKLRLELLELDPVYYRQVDLNNHKRLIHAIEIIYQSGKPYSLLRTGTHKERSFRILKYALELPRDVLFERINRRVGIMMENGLLDEARRVCKYRNLNSLNTVGYKELFCYFDGQMDLPTAIERIRKNTRVYAKKQLTWLKKDPDIVWLTPNEAAERITKDYMMLNKHFK